jgi:hypothetical protein
LAKNQATVNLISNIHTMLHQVVDNNWRSVVLLSSNNEYLKV